MRNEEGFWQKVYTNLLSPEQLEESAVGTLCEEHDAPSMWTNFYTLLSLVLLTMYCLYMLNVMIVGWVYLGVVLANLLFLTPYFTCTHCGHYGKRCASALYESRLAKVLYRPKEEPLSMKEMYITFSAWIVTANVAPVATLIGNDNFLFLISVVMAVTWYKVHDLLACIRCLSSDACPKGKVLHLGGPWKYASMALFFLPTILCLVVVGFRRTFFA